MKPEPSRINDTVREDWNLQRRNWPNHLGLSHDKPANLRASWRKCESHMFKIPKNDNKYHWTNHVIRKMAFYGLTPDRVKRVIRSPKRVEEGIAENTIGVMQPSSNLKKPTEVWVMYAVPKARVKSSKFKVESKDSKFKILNSKFIIISAWRYPGVSPIGKQIPIPQDILEELKNSGLTF